MERVDFHLNQMRAQWAADPHEMVDFILKIKFAKELHDEREAHPCVVTGNRGEKPAWLSATMTAVALRLHERGWSCEDLEGVLPFAKNRQWLALRGIYPEPEHKHYDEERFSTPLTSCGTPKTSVTKS
jgi:hypothetical protein